MRSVGFGPVLIVNLAIIATVIVALLVLKSGLPLLALSFIQPIPMSARFDDDEGEQRRTHMGFVNTDD